MRVRPAPQAKGYSSLDINAVGTNFPAIQDILKYVVDKGKSQVSSKDKVGENFYDRAVLNAALIAEAIRTAQKLTGKKQVNGEDVRRGFETLNITEARWKELGLPRLCRSDPSQLRRPQRSQRHLARRVGRHEVEHEGPIDRADQGQGSAADRERGRGAT